MDDSIINFDQLQDEINEAERYLREEVLRTKAQGYGRSFRSSKEKSSILNSASSQEGSERNIDITTPAGGSTTSTPKKYANPESREKLLNRLMSEHGSKQSTPSFSRSSTAGHAFGNGSTASNQDEFGDSRLVSDFDSRNSSPALSSQSSTPRMNTSGDTLGGNYESGGDSGGDVNYFFKTIKKYSDSNVDDPQLDETLFFASDVVSPSTQGAPPPSLAHRDSQGKHLSTLSAGDDQADFLASHFLQPASPQEQQQQQQSAPPPAPSQQPARTATATAASVTHTRQNARKPTPTASTNASVPATEGSRLRKYLKSKQETIADAENNFKQQHTFKPKLDSSKSKRSSAEKEGGSVDRIDAMIQVHGQALANRERQKIELERSKVQQSCSFRPQLSRGTRQIMMRQKARETGTEHSQQGAVSKEAAASERLYQQAGKHQVQQRMLKHQIDETRHSECTFRPALNPASTSMAASYEEQRPLYERVGDVQRQQAMSRQVLLECYEEAGNEHLTHNPEINDKSRRMVDKSRKQDDSEEPASRSQDATDVGTRLMNEARHRLNRKYRLIEERERELASDVKTPALCRGSQRYVTQNPDIR
jgi:hypothetical protein